MSPSLGIKGQSIFQDDASTPLTPQKALGREQGPLHFRGWYPHPTPPTLQNALGREQGPLHFPGWCPHPTPRNALHTHWQMTSGPCTAGPAPTPSSLPSPERNAASTMGSWGRQKTRDSITFPHLEGAVPIEEATKGPQTDLSHPQLWVLCKGGKRLSGSNARLAACELAQGERVVCFLQFPPQSSLGSGVWLC